MSKQELIYPPATKVRAEKRKHLPPNRMAMNSPAPVVFTVGHSTRLVDVRTLPRSRHNPQFNRETLRRRDARV
jgi:hypothetical protein